MRKILLAGCFILAGCKDTNGVVDAAVSDSFNRPTALLSVSNVSVLEGTGPGTTNAVFTVTASTSSPTPVVVNYSTSDGTATAGSDYTATSGSLTIPANTNSGTISVPIARDSVVEPNETFSLTLSGGSGYLVPGSTLTATATIIDDDYLSQLWDFTNVTTLPTNFIYNSKYIGFSAGGSVNLLQVNTVLNSAATFANGTAAGTLYSGGLTIANEGTTNPSVNTILPTQAANLQAYYRMDGNFNDSSGHGRTAAVYTGTPTATSKLLLGSGSLLLNPSASLAVGPTANLEPSYLTVSVWFKSSLHQGALTNGEQVILATSAGSSQYDNEIILQLYNAGGGNFLVTGTGGSTSVNLPAIAPNSWTHFVGTYDGIRLKGFLNGVKVADVAAALGPIQYVAGQTTWLIGKRWPDGAPLYDPMYLEGAIDELAIWNTAIGEDQASAIYNAQLIAQPDLAPAWTPGWSLISGYWKMDNNWLDSSASVANVLSTTGPPTFVTSAKVGSHAGSFAGGKYAYNTTGIALANSSFSISTWVNPSSAAASQATAVAVGSALTTNNCINAGYASTGPFRFSFYGNDLDATQGSATLDLNTWHHYLMTFNSTTKARTLYRDGISVASDSSMSNFIGAGAIHLGSSCTGLTNFVGFLDDTAVWTTDLSAADVAVIYNRQKQKYAASFDSPVFDLGVAAPWSTLSAVSALPAFKELPAGAESATDYSGMTGNSATSLIGLWHFNETAGTSLADSSAAANTGTSGGGVSLGGAGQFATAITLDGSSGYIYSTNLKAMPVNSTSSTWFRVTPGYGSGGILFQFDAQRTGVPTANYDNTLWMDNAGKLVAGIWTGSAITVTSASAYNDGQWHHAAMTYGPGALTLYVDGKSQGTISATSSQSYSGYWRMGSGLLTGWTDIPSSMFLAANLDEAAVWYRTLSGPEILQLYLRGASRVRYQVRSCPDSTCSVTPWLGPDGTSASYFSELDNNSLISSTGAPLGTVGTGGLNLSFANFPALSAPTPTLPVANPFFQYRVYLESDDINSLCLDSTSNPIPCVPTVTSLTVGPTGRYYGGSPTFVNSTPFSVSNLVGFTPVENIAPCSSYELSIDGGTTWQWWNGSAWAAASGVAQSNYPTDLTAARLGTLGAASFVYKAFLNTSAAFDRACSIRSINLNYRP